MKWLLKKYMIQLHIKSFGDVADAVGMTRRKLYDRMDDPSTLKLYEIQALNRLMHFSDEDLLSLLKGEIKR